jgi:tetratricopeptide (TPR) repeat protein
MAVDPRGARCAVLLLGVVLASCGGSAVTPSNPPRSAASVQPSAPAASQTPRGSPMAEGGGATTQATIDSRRQRITLDPQDGAAYRDLAFALLQRVRETGDASLLVPTQTAVDQAVSLDPEDPLVPVALGSLQLTRHQFADALATAMGVLVHYPGLTPALAIKADALVELGRYREASALVGELAGQHADISTLARASYVAELHGRLTTALDLMIQAAQAGAETPENLAYVTVLQGNLEVYLGKRDQADATYQRALNLVPGYAPALAAQGRLAVGANDLATAVERFKAAADVLPLPEYVIAQGEAQEAAGDPSAAQTYALARAEIGLFQANGAVVDLELALFEADHGDPNRALSLARQAYAERPTVKAADTLAWAHYRLGRLADAATKSKEAVRMGSRDPLILFHAGAIALATGDHARGIQLLHEALTTDPGFSATAVAEARRLLAQAGG